MPFVELSSQLSHSDFLTVEMSVENASRSTNDDLISINSCDLNHDDSNSVEDKQ